MTLGSKTSTNILTDVFDSNAGSPSQGYSECHSSVKFTSSARAGADVDKTNLCRGVINSLMYDKNEMDMAVDRNGTVCFPQIHNAGSHKIAAYFTHHLGPRLGYEIRIPQV